MDENCKPQALAQIHEHLAAELATLTRAADAAQDAATHAENKPENKYDTRGLEASYLAGAQRERAEVVRSMIEHLKRMVCPSFSDDDAIAPTALVELDHDGVSSHCLILAIGAGIQLSLGARKVTVITPKSLLGSALMGRFAGDDVTVATPQGPKTYHIVAVR
jgi:transcription elongation GreA/GreB family factor